MADPVFNPDEPFGVVYGHPDYSYFQKGHHFGADKRYIAPDAPPTNEMEYDGLDELHWTQLRSLVEKNEGEYSNKDDAIIYLRERGVKAKMYG